jgi:hypothetical protein
MVYVEAISPSGISQSTVAIEDAVWSEYATYLRAEGGRRGYIFNVLSFVPTPGSINATERHCPDLSAAIEWIRTLDPEED